MTPYVAQALAHRALRRAGHRVGSLDAIRPERARAMASGITAKLRRRFLLPFGVALTQEPATFRV